MPDTIHEPTHSCLEDDCATGRRNRFFKGKRMSFQAFALDQDYLIERRRLLNRSLYGWGVVSGFNLEPKGSKISRGFALDRHGREIVLAEGCRFDFRECYRDDPGGDKFRPGRWVLRVHYAERLLGEQLLPTDCGCEDREWNEVCETVVFSLKRLEHEEHCPQGETPCPQCKCHHPHDCCPRDPHLHAHQDRGRQCLCEWITRHEPEHEPGELCEWRERRLRFALCDPVPLACIRIGEDECQCLIVESLDECAPRRLVKRNDVLFDLIRGCDLTRIERISWGEWHRRPAAVHWEEFRHKFHSHDDTPPPSPPPDDPHAKPRVTGFKVWFTKPVESRTLTRDCFAFSAMLLDKGTGWERVKRVPIVGVATELAPDGSRAPLTSWAAIAVDRRWMADEIRGTWSEFDDGPTTIEIEVRGDYILDCNGQAVSAGAIGLWPLPSGNGMPGGTFVSTFRVASKPDHD